MKDWMQDRIKTLTLKRHTYHPLENENIEFRERAKELKDAIITFGKVLGCLGNEPIIVFGSKGKADGLLEDPWGVAVDLQGNIVVVMCATHLSLSGPKLTCTQSTTQADSGNHQIQVFDREGRFLHKFGQFGSKEDQLHHPSDVAIDPDRGNFIIADLGNNQIKVTNIISPIHVVPT